MRILDSLYRSLLIERPAAKRLPGELAAELDAAGQKIQERIATAENTEKNRQSLSHIIGIERWGQRRLRVALGEPFVEERYNRYQPDRELSMGQLQQQFQETRAETVVLAQKLAESKQWAVGAIRHNDLGDLSVRGWMQYLLVHANLESKRIR